MRGNNSVGLALQQSFEDSFGYRSTNRRLSTRAKLVDEYERALRGLLKHSLHIHKVRRVGRQVVLDRLLVTDVD